MSIVEPLGVREEQLAQFCRTWQVAELALFGSALREDFRPESDVDLLVTFTAESRHSLFDLVAMEAELCKIFGRKVDLVEKRAIERSENYIRRRNILSTAKVVYAAR
jgi:predicted nucleotidyltransferase